MRRVRAGKVYPYRLAIVPKWSPDRVCATSTYYDLMPRAVHDDAMKRDVRDADNMTTASTMTTVTRRFASIVCARM
jgi:hypothetical protein